MAVTNFTSLLGLALPTTGDLSGTWGTTVNDSITQLLDSAVAGTTTLSADADITLSTTNGSSNQAREAILLWTASNSVTRYVTAPAHSKAYVVINAGTASIVLRGAGPTTGVTVAAGEKCLAAWNGSDFVKVSSSVADGVTSVDVSGGTTGLTTSGGPVTSSGTITLAGTLAVANGGTGATTLTGLVKGSGTSAFTAAVSGTDYAPATSGTSILYGNGSGGFSNVTVGSNLTFAGGTLSATSSGGSVTSVSGTGTVNGITLSGTVTSSGSLTLGGALSGVSLTSQVTGTLPVANGGTGVTTSTGTGSVVLSTSPTLTTPALGTPSSVTLTNATGLPIDAGTTGTLPISRGGTGATSTQFVNLATNVTGTLPVANGGTGVTSSTGSGSVVLSTSPTLTTPVLGTPTSGTLSNCTVDGTNAIGYRSIPPVGTKTTSYVLTTADVGKYVQVGSGGSITIPDATFAEGNAISIFNNTAGNITITCSITTAYIAGTDSDKATMTLATRGVATILFISSTLCVVSGNVT